MSDFIQRLQNYRQRVDDALLAHFRQLDFPENALSVAMRYGALLGGKRLRPYLVYATGNMFNVPLPDLDPAAAAVECIHAYSLIHDDLPAMDNDSLRRGQPTCHIKYGEANAILAGDALQTLAFSILVDTPMSQVSLQDRLGMLSELAHASGANGMCIGQVMDMSAEGKQIGLSELEQIHRHKTGALIQAAVRMGALAAGKKGKAALVYLDRYAQAIGLAFQVQDDILDVIGDTEKTGKRQGSDQELGKSTYPSLLGLERAQLKAGELYQEATNALSSLKEQGYDTMPLEALAAFIVERDN